VKGNVPTELGTIAFSYVMVNDWPAFSVTLLRVTVILFTVGMQ